MRGLTARERMLLSFRQSESVNADSVGLTIQEMSALVQIGRFAKVYEDDRIERFDATDLGLLALRVCPVDEH